MELVAFPQSGVMTKPGTLELLDAALSEGADLVGGLDPAGMDEAEFIKLTRRALSHYGDLTKLTASPDRKSVV